MILHLLLLELGINVLIKKRILDQPFNFFKKFLKLLKNQNLNYNLNLNINLANYREKVILLKKN